MNFIYAYTYVYMCVYIYVLYILAVPPLRIQDGYGPVLDVALVGEMGGGGQASKL